MRQQTNNTFSEVQQLGHMVRKIRASRRITISSLVENTGLSQSIISKFERGQTDIQFSSIIRILGAMALTMDDLCQAQVFSGFIGNEWIEKAYRHQKEPDMLADILDQLKQMSHHMPHESVFQMVLEMGLQLRAAVPDEVITYFDHLSGVYTFDAYLALLAAPLLPERICLRIVHEATKSNTHQSAIINEVVRVYNQSVDN